MRRFQSIAKCGFVLLAFSVLVGSISSPLFSQTPPATTTPAAPQATPPRFTPTPEMLAIQAASEKDHRRMMDLLGIKELRPAGENYANWDESKANVYPNLPDPLVEKNGKHVTTAEEW